MIEDKTILAIIPARGGSKGILKKNIHPLGGKPLIAWTIEEAKKSRYIDRLILSSDDFEIIEVAKKYGCEVPFIRPNEISQDTSSAISTILHALEALQQKFDYIVFLQPTSPLRNVKDIDRCIEIAIENKGMCVSVTKPDKSPFWMYLPDEKGFLKPILKTEAVRRQDLPDVLVLNGAVYVGDATILINENSFITNATSFYLMPKNRSIDIDEELDLILAEHYLKMAKD